MSKVIHQIFDDYSKSRIQFTQNISDLCLKAHNIEILINTDIIILLRPLILDKVPIVQQNATVILAKLASYSEEVALTILQNDVLPHLIYCLKHENKNYRKNCAYTLRCLANHNSKLANIVAEENCVDYLMDCLDEYDLRLKESCINALCAIVKNDLELSNNVVNKGIIPLLILCLQEKDNNLIKSSLNILSELSKQSNEIAKNVVDNNALPSLIKFLDNNDVHIKRYTCNCLSQIAKHKEELTELMIENDIFPKILYLLKDNDDIVKKNCANSLKEMSKHNEDICKIIVRAGTLPFLCECIEQSSKDSIKLPAILCLGFISSFSESLSLNIILANAIPILKKCMIEETEDYIKSASVWTVGNIGKHSPEHAKKLSDENVLIILVNLYNANDSSDDLKKKVKISLKGIIQKVTDLEALQPVFLKSSLKLAKYSIFQFSKILPKNPSYKKSFIKSGCLKYLQEIKNSDEAKKIEVEINSINKSFPEDIVNYYTPGYSETLIKKIDEVDKIYTKKKRKRTKKKGRIWSILCFTASKLNRLCPRYKKEEKNTLTAHRSCASSYAHGRAKCRKKRKKIKEKLSLCQRKFAPEQKKNSRWAKRISHIWQGKKVVAKNCLIEYETDIINALKNAITLKLHVRRKGKGIETDTETDTGENDVTARSVTRSPSSNEVTAQSVMQLLQSYSKNRYSSNTVIKLIITYIKHNTEGFSPIRLCVCLNYLVNLKVKTDEMFDYIMRNALVKKLKNDEHIDLYGICLIAKYVLHKKIKNIELMYLLCNLTKSKINTSCSSYDMYNLIVSFLTIQNVGLLADSTCLHGNYKSSYRNDKQVMWKEIGITTMELCMNTSSNVYDKHKIVTKLNEENIHHLLLSYINSERVINEEIVLIINTLTSINKDRFFHKIKQSGKDKTAMYEAYLRKLQYGHRFEAKVLALLLFNVQKIFKLNEISEKTLFTVIRGSSSAFALAATRTKERSRLLGGKSYQRGSFEQKGENGRGEVDAGKSDNFVDWTKQDRRNSVCMNNKRLHFTIQEIGMIFQFYDFFHNFIREMNRKEQSAQRNVQHLGKNMHHTSVLDSDNRNQLGDYEPGDYTSCSFQADVLRSDQSEKSDQSNFFEPYINMLRKSLFFYSLQTENGKMENMNILDFCTVFKGFCKICKNTLLDKKILTYFQNFFILNQNKIYINELKMILKVIFERKSYDIFDLLCNNTKNKFFNHLQNVLMKNVLNTKVERSNSERVEPYVMCFYYISFLQFNANTYMIVNHFIMKGVRSRNMVNLIPYIIISIFNYHKLESKLIRGNSKMRYIKNKEQIEVTYGVVSHIEGKSINPEMNGNNFPFLGSSAHLKNNLLSNITCENQNPTCDIGRIHILYKLMNKHFVQYKIYYILNCVYILTKFLKEKKVNILLLSNFHFPDLFQKIYNKLKKELAVNSPKSILNHYDYFINYVKYNYCLSFLNYYIHLGNLMEKTQYGRKFTYSFYTPFNAYLVVQFLANHEHSLTDPCYISTKKMKLSQGIEAILCHNEVVNMLDKIKAEKRILLANMIKYMSSHYKQLHIYDIVNWMRTLKFLSSQLNYRNMRILHNFVLNKTQHQHVKISTIFEMLIEYIKFLYYLELQNGMLFEKCKMSIGNIFTCTFRIILKNLLNNAENNYIGMLQFSLLYVYHFVEKSHYILNSLPLEDLRKANHFTDMVPMNLENFDYSFTSQEEGEGDQEQLIYGSRENGKGKTAHGHMINEQKKEKEAMSLFPSNTTQVHMYIHVCL
ncbi:armadillo repeat protein PF16, putative (PF16) [Plasmodium ovale curtisi]|uniref:Armadillo repeat protein PF16, putative (PF16) n=1 Tax=Plasmodium ovale curtisi TaxID=864141 RepID=A0A1A8WH98_PLAOA|nr:armadillo repeat protein PF16, putative (PF16) [Plasmodium ovale curtisi]